MLTGSVIRAAHPDKLHEMYQDPHTTIMAEGTRAEGLADLQYLMLPAGLTVDEFTTCVADILARIPSIQGFLDRIPANLTDVQGEENHRAPPQQPHGIRRPETMAHHSGVNCVFFLKQPFGRPRMGWPQRRPNLRPTPILRRDPVPRGYLLWHDGPVSPNGCLLVSVRSCRYEACNQSSLSAERTGHARISTFQALPDTGLTERLHLFTS